MWTTLCFGAPSYVHTSSAATASLVVQWAGVPAILEGKWESEMREWRRRDSQVSSHTSGFEEGCGVDTYLASNGGGGEGRLQDPVFLSDELPAGAQ